MFLLLVVVSIVLCCEDHEEVRCGDSSLGGPMCTSHFLNNLQVVVRLIIEVGISGRS